MTSEAPPWSSTLRLSEVQRGARGLTLIADEATRRRIATLLDLLELARLEGEVTVAPWLDGAELRARWSADVQQTCSVSAEPFGSTLTGDFAVRAVPADSRAAPAADAEISADPDAEDPPDVLDGDTLDVAAYLVEALALSLDPFPRAPGAEFTPPEPEPDGSPFAALAALRLTPPDA